MKRTWLLVALTNFFVAAGIGALLRFAFVEEISGLNFKNVLHAHSHVAMLGWVYMALFALLLAAFISDNHKERRYYNGLFWVTQISVIGMLISFVLQGYGPVSIGFSIMHILCSYVFVGWFWTDLPKTKSFSSQLIKTAMLFMVLSTIAIWMMGPIMATKLRGSAFYHMAVQFYLHFQFNGWFLFAVLALLFKTIEQAGITLPLVLTKRFYALLVTSCILTYALAVAWMKPLPIMFFLNSAGVILQLGAFLFFLLLIRKKGPLIFQLFSKLERVLLGVALASFGSKIIVQSLVAIPYMAEIGFTIRNYVIGFIHLVLLGGISSFILAYAVRQADLSLKSRLAQWGLWAFIAGFVLSECLLFLQGTLFWGSKGFLPFYYEALFLASSLIPIGILLLGIGQWKTTIDHVRVEA